MDFNFKNVLAIESSCDDTSVSIVRSVKNIHDFQVVALSSANQDLQHAPFGGVVPEIASRNHSGKILPLIEKTLEKASMTWKDIDGIAVTNRPGLVGSLLVGIVTAKTLGLAKDIPFIGVNHLEGHLLAPLLRDETYAPSEEFRFPFIGLVVSGGHTSLCLVKDYGQYDLIGQTVDDAAGEAFDKFAKMAGLGYPGGVHVDKNAKNGDSKAFDFPRSLIKEENLLFSFSGLKASAQRKLQSMTPDEISNSIEDLCASYQQAIVDVLVKKLERAVRSTGVDSVVISGGVSANSGLRSDATYWAEKNEINILIPPLRYCTDNAAMIGAAGIWRLNSGETSNQKLAPYPRSLENDFVNCLSGRA